MDTYLVFRRNAWHTTGEQKQAAVCSLEESKQTPDAVSWIRSYVVAERDGSIGTVCVFQASSPEAVRTHAERAELPVDEIVVVTDTIVVQRDPATLEGQVDRR